jgi:hypothetical protein
MGVILVFLVELCSRNTAAGLSHTPGRPQPGVSGFRGVRSSDCSVLAALHLVGP